MAVSTYRTRGTIALFPNLSQSEALGPFCDACEIHRQILIPWSVQ